MAEPSHHLAGAGKGAGDDRGGISDGNVEMAVFDELNFKMLSVFKVQISGSLILEH